MKSERGFAVMVLIGVGCAVSGSRALAPQIQDTQEGLKYGHYEHPVPNSAPDGIASTARATSIAAIISFGRFMSVQVNVNGAGNNIVGDAANEPSIAVDPTDHNRMAIGWRQFDTIANSFRKAGVGYSTDGGLTWTFPGVIRPNEFASDPVLNSDANGRFYYLSLQPNRGPGNWACYMYASTDGGVTWPQDRYAYGGDKAWFDVDTTNGPGRGAVYMSWSPNTSATCCGTNTFSRSLNGGLSWMDPIPTPVELFAHSLAVGPDSELYIFGSDLFGTFPNPLQLVRSDNAYGPFQTPTFDVVTQVDLDGVRALGGGPNPVGLIGQHWVDVDLSNGPTRGNVYVLSSVARLSNSDPADVMFARSTNGGLSFSPPVRLNDDPVDNGAWQWMGTMSVAPNGRLDVVWDDTRGDTNQVTPTISQLYYTYSFDAGDTWSTPEPVGPIFNPRLGWPSQNKLGDYYDMDSDNDGADLAYAATYNGGQDVYYVRLTPDCNGNGLPDVTDIAGGAPDCNGNGILDECEPNLDCNNNGTQDICDIASGFSADCNSNFIPDECEPNNDCNTNTIQDICDIASGFSADCNGNGVPDECEPDGDCNGNGVLDECDVALGGTSPDCNSNGIPDECDIASGFSADNDGDGVPDECRGACCFCGSCGQLTAQQCHVQGGTFKGIGVACLDAGCPEVPANDTCAGAISLPGDALLSIPFDNACTSNDGPATVVCEAPGAIPPGNDLWYTYNAPCCGVMSIDICDVNFDAILGVYGGGASCTCPGASAASLLRCSDDGCGPASGGRFTLAVEKDACYVIEVAGFTGQGVNVVGVGTLNISVSCYPTDDIVVTPEPNSVIKSRYVSFVPPQLAERTAIRITLDDVSGFSSFNGEARWLGAPQQYPEENSAAPSSTFWGSRLSCEPFFTDWGALGVVHVFGGEIVPESSFTVEVIRESCSRIGIDETALSDPVPSVSGVWGDVVSPFAGVGPRQPDFTDIASVVAKFIQGPTAPIKASAQLQANTPRPDEPISFRDIAAAVSGFIPEPYPFVGPCACPSTVTCGATACGDNTPCAGGMCISGFCTDPCGRCTP